MTEPTSRPSGRSGFTLVELMVVILIISILSGIVLTALSGNDPQQNLQSGVSRMSGLFSLARSAAITRKTPTRVLVNYEPYDANDDTHQRSALIVYYDDTDSMWKVYSDMETLPTGIYFSGEHSRQGDTPLEMWTVTLNPTTYTLDYGGNDALTAAAGSPGANRWYAYEFNPNGTFSNPGAWLVLASGVLAGTNLTIPDENLTDGFVTFRAGRPMYFQDPRQINP